MQRAFKGGIWRIVDSYDIIYVSMKSKQYPLTGKPTTTKKTRVLSGYEKFQLKRLRSVINGINKHLSVVDTKFRLGFSPVKKGASK